MGDGIAIDYGLHAIDELRWGMKANLGTPL